MKNELYDNMYNDYLRGMSLQDVGRKYGMTRQSVYIGFKRRGYKLKTATKQVPQKFNGNNYTLRNNGYLGRTNGDRSLMHRDVWEYHHGTIPLGHDIHHKNHDKTDNRIENLELLTKADHARQYATGRNQFTK